MQKIRRRSMMLGAASAAVLPSVRRARAARPALRLGCLTDLSGPYAAISGQGSVAACKLAIEDFNKLHPDIPVDLLVADFGLKPDVGLTILRSWFDNEGVDAILDVPSSAVALASTGLLEQKNKVGLFTTALTSELSRGHCGPNHLQFSSDTYKIAASLATAVLGNGGSSWYIIAPNNEFGKSMAGDTSNVVTSGGGTVAGVAFFPFPSTGDFSSYMLQGRAAGAKVLCLAGGGEDVVTFVKQAAEFGVRQSGELLAAPLMADSSIKGIGLEAAQGTLFTNPYYWDRNDGTRDFAQRLVKLAPDRWASVNSANAYSGAFNYLKAAASLGVEAAKADGRATVRRLKQIGVDDELFGPGKIRENGEVMRDMLLLKVKTPGQSKGAWDYCDIVKTIPGDALVRPLSKSVCALM